MRAVAWMALVAVSIGSAVPQNANVDAELLARAATRIEQSRKADAVVRVVDRDGEPIPGVRIRIEQTRHAFLFGANAFPLLGHRDPRIAGAYQKLFADLLNYATLGFYWGTYEREPGKPDEARLRAQAQWCKSRGIAVKGHPLVWHEVFPAWGPKDADSARESQRRRVSEIARGFAGLIDMWDVVNEATVSDRFSNGIGLWARRDGAAKMVGDALIWARTANPRALLLYNDFNVGPSFETLLGHLIEEKRPIDVIGIQSHMHRGEWTLEKAWQVCETYARFGKPLHFTELTVLSGEHGWMRPRPWPSTAAGEARQADYVEKLYRLLFSHPAVKAITWWDLVDGAWQGAPAGLIRADLTPKPAYLRLHSLIRGEWWTRQEAETDSRGEVRFRGFLGDYRIAAESGTSRLERSFTIKPGSANRLSIILR